MTSVRGRQFDLQAAAAEFDLNCDSVGITSGCRGVVRNEKTEWVDVKQGASVGKLVEVFGDLQLGDVVALKGHPKPANEGHLKTGQRE